jgi:hypothetical protein
MERGGAGKTNEVPDARDAGGDFERIFLETILEMMEESKLNKSELARASFPYRSDPGRALRAMITRNRLGKPQKITVRDAYNFANALGKDFAFIVHMARQKMLHAEEVKRQEASKPPAGGRSGRPRKK